MSDQTFKKGLHPPHHKETSGSATEVIMPNKGDVLIYPMSQHIGAPCKPVVEVGEKV